MVVNSVNQDFWKIDKYGKTLQNEILASYRLIRMVMILSAVLFAFTATGYFFKPLMSSMRVLPVDVYFLSNIDNSFTYAAVYTFQLILTLIFGIPCLLGFDFLFISLIAHILNEIKMIKLGLITLPIDGNVLENESMEEIKQIIDHHSMVLNCAKYLRESCSPIILNQFLITIFITAISLLNVITAGFPPSLPDLMKPLPYMVSYLSVLFFYCYGGTALINESQSIADAAYESRWWIKTQPELRRSLVAIMRRAQKAEKLTAGGMFDVTLINFTNVVRTAFSFYTLAQAVFVEEEEE